MEIPCPKGLSYLPYQIDGIRWAADRTSVLFGDEMGLGKSIEAIGYINCHPEVKDVLVVCPASLKINWQREMEKWLTHTLTRLTIINYDILHKLVTKRPYDLVIYDEIHYAKSRMAKRSRLCRTIKADRKLGLTGTPLLNRPVELWHLLHLLDPITWPLNSYNRYTARYCNAHRGRWGWDVSGASNLDELREKLKPLMIRRLKSEVMKDLPPKRRQIITLPIDGLTSELKDQILKVDRDAEAIESAYANDVQKMDSKLAVLWDEIADLRHKVGLAKVDMAVELIEGVAETGEKVIVFAHHRDVIAGLVQKLHKFNPVVIHGGVGLVDRQKAVDAFQNDLTVKVFVGQIQAAGVGITLHASSTTIFVEEDWTPGVMAQAEDRSHRIGQKNSVLIQYLVLDKSLDARMIKSAYKKETIIKRVLDPTTEREEEEMAATEIKIGLDDRTAILAERLVVVLERMVGGVKECSRPVGCCEPVRVTESVTSVEHATGAGVEQGPLPVASAPIPEATKPVVEGALDREGLKAELRKRGIKFKDAAKTENLQKLLAESLGVPPSVAAEVMKPYVSAPKDSAVQMTHSAPIEPEVVITKEEVKTALIHLATKKNREEALYVLNVIGKAESISKIEPEFYAVVIKACAERTKGL